MQRLEHTGTTRCASSACPQASKRGNFTSEVAAAAIGLAGFIQLQADIPAKIHIAVKKKNYTPDFHGPLSRWELLNRGSCSKKHLVNIITRATPACQSSPQPLPPFKKQGKNIFLNWIA